MIMFTDKQKRARFDVISLILHDMYKKTDYLGIDVNHKITGNTVFHSFENIEQRLVVLQSILDDSNTTYVLFTFAENRELQFAVNLNRDGSRETISQFLSNSFDYNLFNRGKEDHRQFHDIIHSAIATVKQRHMPDIRTMREEVTKTFLRAVVNGDYLDHLVAMTYELAQQKAIDPTDTLDNVVAAYFAGSEKATKEWYDWFAGEEF